MEISFYPKTERHPDGTLKTNKAGKVSLQMLVHHHGPAKVGIGLSIYPEFWDKEAQRVTRKHPAFKAVNDTITAAVNRVEEIERTQRMAHGYATVEEIAAEYKAKTRAPKKEKKAPAIKELPLDMEAVNQRWKRENKGFVAENTLRKYDQIVGKLNKYFPGLTAPEIDEPFIRKYLTLLAGEELAKGTIYKHAEFLKLARAAAGLPTRIKALTVKAINAPQPDLTIPELRQLIGAELNKFHLETERDVFLFQMFVPLRESHFRTLQPHHLQRITVQDHGEIPVISTMQLKTETPVVLPLPPLALRIWEKYGGRLPFVSQQKRNLYIKQICLQAGLTRGFVVRHHKLKGFTETLTPLWKVVSTYTTRHTAASLMLEVTGDESLSGWLLGHTNHGVAGVTGVYAKKKAAKALPAILAAWEEILGDAELPG